MAVTFLKDAAQDAFGPKKSIIDILCKELGGYQPARSHETVHASDITKCDFCPRQTALLTVLKAKKKDEYISTALQVTFDAGNAMSDLFREKWAGQHVYGNWSCKRCNSTVTFKRSTSPVRWEVSAIGGMRKSPLSASSTK